jgi:hypothetical protein
MAKNEMPQGKGRAGLPEQPSFKDYPKCDYVHNELDDTITRVDREKEQMVRTTKKKISNQH